MSTKQPCLFSISDWINFLNSRALELGNMVISKKARTKGELSIVIAVIAIILASLFGMINLLPSESPAINFVLYFIILIVFSYLILRFEKGKDNEFEQFFKQYQWSTIRIDSLITRIMDGDLKKSEQIREEYKKYCKESLEKFPYPTEELSNNEIDN